MTAASITSNGFIHKLFGHTVKNTHYNIHNNTHKNRVLSRYDGVIRKSC